MIVLSLAIAFVVGAILRLLFDLHLRRGYVAMILFGFLGGYGVGKGGYLGIVGEGLLFGAFVVISWLVMERLIMWRWNRRSDLPR